jgi:hypothetical protein
MISDRRSVPTIQIRRSRAAISLRLSQERCTLVANRDVNSNTTKIFKN